jgi:hypothetical protein
MNKLTRMQLRKFKRNGFLEVGKIFADSELEQLIKAFARIGNKPPKGVELIFEDRSKKSGVLWVGSDLGGYSGILQQTDVF